MVWTSDGKDVEWPYSDTPMTTVSSDVLNRCRSKSPLISLLAHAEMTHKQVSILYRKSLSLRSYGAKRRRTGIVIKCLELQPYAVGVSECNLIRALGPKAVRYDRLKAIEAIMRYT